MENINKKFYLIFTQILFVGKEQSPQWNQNYDAEYGIFADNDDRRNFISRVYLILSVAISFCALVVFLTSY